MLQRADITCHLHCLPFLLWMHLAVLRAFSMHKTSDASIQICPYTEDLPQQTILKIELKQDLHKINISVTNLKIFNSNLQDLSNYSFSYLTRLIAFDLRENSITNISETTFCGMRNLQILDLGDNMLSNITKTVFQDLKQLRHLYLDNNKLVSIESVKYLTNLQFLDVSANQLSRIGTIPELTSLKILRLRNSNITTSYLTSDTFAPLTSLCELDLTNNHMSTEALQLAMRSVSVKSIWTLKVGNQQNVGSQAAMPVGTNHFPNSPTSVFPMMTSLIYLDLSQTLIAGSYDSSIKDLFPSLKYIFLRSNNLYNIPGWVVNSSIEYLDLSNNRIANWDLRNYMPKLKNLNLHNNNIQHLGEGNNFLAFSKLETLAITNNNLFDIKNYTLQSLSKLKTLDLSNNTMEDISDYAFSGLVSLTTLYLQNNNIKIYRNNTPLAKLYNLRELVFHHNSLCDIWPWALPDQINLEILDFSHNKIEPWLVKAFSFNKKLRILNVSNNEINKFSEIMLQELTEPQFQYINLSENDFICEDCSISNLQKWSLHMTSNCSTEESQLCSMYRNFKCLDKAQNIVNMDLSKYVIPSQCKTEKNVSLWVKIVAPVVTVVLLTFIGMLYHCRWYVKYYWYLWFGNCCFKRQWKSTDTYEYNAYISYAETDRVWLQNTFLPSLENQQTNLHFYVLERDFQPGRFVIENIIEGMEKSCFFLALLSPEYLRNSWRLWEFNWATCRLASQEVTEAPKVLILNLGGVSEKEMNCTMRSVLRTQFHEKWSHENPKQRLIWEKLINLLTGHSVNNNNSDQEDQNTRF